MSDERTEDVRPSVTELSYKQTTARMKDLADEIKRVAGKADVTAKDDDYLRELKADFDECESHARKLERKSLIERVDVATGNPLTAVAGDNPRKSDEFDADPFGEPDSVRNAPKFKNPWALDEMRRMQSPTAEAQELRARALSAVEKMAGTTDKTRETMTNIIETWDNGRGKIAKQALLTSSPEYLSAFNKQMSGRGASLNEKERNALERAMSLTDTAGGFLIPFQLDPAVIITSNGSTNPIRQISRKVMATGDVWSGVSAGATGWSWDGADATTAVSDDASTFAQPQITIRQARGFVPISLAAFQDEPNVAQEVGRLLAFGKDTLESAAFATGLATNNAPIGIVSALNTVTTSIVTATTNNSFGLVDLYAMDEALPARYRANASWVAHRAIYNDVRQFDTSGGAALWERLGNDVPPLLLGRPAYEASDMDGALATADDYALVFGDFQYYVIADRIGTTVEFVPHLFSSNSMPTGQKGWFAYYRVGADSVNDGAFRLLHV